MIAGPLSKLKPQMPSEVILPKGLKAAAPNEKQLKMLTEDDVTTSGGTNSIVDGQPLLSHKPVHQPVKTR